MFYLARIRVYTSDPQQKLFSNRAFTLGQEQLPILLMSHKAGMDISVIVNLHVSHHGVCGFGCMGPANNCSRTVNTISPQASSNLLISRNLEFCAEKNDSTPPFFPRLANRQSTISNHAKLQWKSNKAAACQTSPSFQAGRQTGGYWRRQSKATIMEGLARLWRLKLRSRQAENDSSSSHVCE